MKKLWLIEEFCPVDQYHCLMPVEYESVEQEGVIKEYHKIKMVCRHAKAGKCEHESECVFYAAATEVMDKNANWYEP